MSHQVKIVSALLGCAAAMLALAAAPANATVYNVNRTIDGGSVVGTITTDGATGTINPSDFITRSGIQVIASTAGTVPEPSTWALMLLGFAGLGYAGFRQNRTRAAAA
jgi:hypothetical protein